MRSVYLIWYLILEVQILVPLVRHGVVRVTHISRVLPVHYSARVLLHTSWLVRRVLVLRYAGPVDIRLRIVDNLTGVTRGCVMMCCVTYPGWLEYLSGRLQVLLLPEDGPILQLGKTLACKICINRTSEDKEIMFRQ